jgi:translation initiation factor IF-2
MTKKTAKLNAIPPRAPIVTILGHVDHGKTTLLDTIRNTNVAGKENGGITQAIGTYYIDVPKNLLKTDSPRRITFIDTPGHLAFAKMRARGSQVADIAILVVAGNDGIMPQTIESISHIQTAKIPTIVAINKIDLPDINIEKVKKQLARAGLNLEEYGGDIPVVPISAKSGKGVDKLLEMILLISELFIKNETAKINLHGVVIESKMTRARGIAATVIVRSGTLSVGQDVTSDEKDSFRVRAIFDWHGIGIPKLLPGESAEILGWHRIPEVGSILTDLPPSPMAIQQKTNAALSVPPLTPNTQLSEDKIRIILKADSTGSLEAIVNGITKNAEVIMSGVGAITESDVLMAKTTKAIIVGFNTQIHPQVAKLAESEKIIIKTYGIIYELFEELEEVIEAIKEGNLVKILGEAKIIALFPTKETTIAGVKVTSGRIARGDLIKIMRGEEEIGRAKITSLRHLKEDVTKAEQGLEAGVILSQKVDLLTGDSIISIG